MCRGCIVPLDCDPDLFDGRSFLGSTCTSWKTRSGRRRRSIIANACSSIPQQPYNDQGQAAFASVAEGSPSLGIDSYEERNIVAEGMKRFEGIDKIAPPQPKIERLSPRVVSILGMNSSQYTLNGTNCYLVGTGPRRILIDAAEGAEFCGQEHFDGFMENVEQALTQEGCTGLEMIIITHLHGDHWGAAQKLQERWGPTLVAMLPAEPWTCELFTMAKIREHGLLETIRNGPSSMRDGKYDFMAITEETELPAWPDEDVSWDIFGRTKAEIHRDFVYCEWTEIFYDTWRAANDTMPSLELKHGQVIKTEGATLRVMHTPGHAANHATLVLEEEHSLFSGDHVLGYGTTIFEDLYDYMASLEAMRRYKPVRLYPGHGAYIADGTGLLTRYVQHRQAREDQIVSFCAGRSMTVMQIAAALYTNTSTTRMQYARENVEKVMFKLWREGRVTGYADASKSKLAALPQEGYLFRLPEGIVWDWQPSMRSGRNKLDDLIQFIASAGDSTSKARL